MKRTGVILFSFVLSSFFLADCSAQDPKPKVLVFSATKGYRHKSIAAGRVAMEKLALKHGFAVEASENPEKFTPTNLEQYKAVVFLNTTGSFFNDQQRTAFRTYMKNGGGFVGIHSAADTFHDWPWYGKMVGAYFLSHPSIQQATLEIKNRRHISTRHLPATWQHKDEWYNFKSINPRIQILITVDEGSYSGGQNGANHPISWFQQYEGGRAFYTALGHRADTYRDERFLQHLLGGLQWVMGAPEF